MSDLFLLEFGAFDKAFLKDDFDMLDEVLDEFLEAPSLKRDVKGGSSSMTSSCKNEGSVNVIVVSVAPQRPKRPYIHVIAASPSPKRFKTINGKPFKGEAFDLYTRFMQSKQSSYNTIAHTYNTRNNKQVHEPPRTSLPPSQPILPKVPLLVDMQPSDYNLIEQLKVTPAKISLWDLLQTVSMYQGML